MADLRVNDINPELLFDLKVIALDNKKTLRELVIEVLTQYRNRKARAA